MRVYLSGGRPQGSFFLKNFEIENGPVRGRLFNAISSWSSYGWLVFRTLRMDLKKLRCRNKIFAGFHTGYHFRRVLVFRDRDRIFLSPSRYRVKCVIPRKGNICKCSIIKREARPTSSRTPVYPMNSIHPVRPHSTVRRTTSGLRSNFLIPRPFGIQHTVTSISVR